MKIAPVSADLLVKLALGGAAVLGAVWALQKITGYAGDTAGRVWDGVANGAAQAWDATARAATTTFNPLSSDNAAYSGVNAFGAYMTGDKHFNYGGDLYSWLWGDAGVTDPTPLPAPRSNYDETERLLARYPKPYASEDLADYRYF